MNPKDITKKPVKEKLSIFRRDEQGRIIVDDREEIKQLNKKNNELKIAQEQMDDLKKKNYLSLSPEDKEKVYEYNFEKICEKMQRELSDEKLNEITDWFFLKILSLTIDEFGIKDKIIIKDMKNGLVWNEKEEGLLFLLKDNETFKKIYNTHEITIYGVRLN